VCACGAYGGGERCAQGVGGETFGKEAIREDNIKMDFQEVGEGCGDWMELAQERDRWRALVSTVGSFLTSFKDWLKKDSAAWSK
jgi:hypothetical protein